MTDEQKAFLDKAAQFAQSANHVFPRMAACEAALESAWGKSALAQDDNNLFGMKAHLHPVFPTVSLPTKEFEQGEWVPAKANWEKYPDWAACFWDRMVTLTRLSHLYPHYAAALQAQDAETYIREVSQSWSTDPRKAEKVLDIYRQYAS